MNKRPVCLPIRSRTKGHALIIPRLMQRRSAVAEVSSGEARHRGRSRPRQRRGESG